jgi:diketogulonate reductase-like aldo/keto reductase
LKTYKVISWFHKLLFQMGHNLYRYAPGCDQGQLKLLAFLGSMVGRGVQRSPLQVALNYVMCKGAVPELTSRSGANLWECGGAMLWRLDENAVGILDERAAATAAGKTGGGGSGGEGEVAAA